MPGRKARNSTIRVRSSYQVAVACHIEQTAGALVVEAGPWPHSPGMHIETEASTNVPGGETVSMGDTVLDLLGEDAASHWMAAGGGRAGWRFERGLVEVVPGQGDIVTREVFTDFQLHLEFWLPHMPRAQGQDRANSGVYLQGRYEVQLLDSFGQPPTQEGCGALYQVRAPLWNACAAPEIWQRLDVAFRAPCLDTAGRVAEHARVTVFLNRTLVHNNVSLRGPTVGALEPYEAQPGPIRLQDHGARVRFRHLWIRPIGDLCDPAAGEGG